MCGRCVNFQTTELDLVTLETAVLPLFDEQEKEKLTVRQLIKFRVTRRSLQNSYLLVQPPWNWINGPFFGGYLSRIFSELSWLTCLGDMGVEAFQIEIAIQRQFSAPSIVHLTPKFFRPSGTRVFEGEGIVRYYRWGEVGSNNHFDPTASDHSSSINGQQTMSLLYFLFPKCI